MLREQPMRCAITWGIDTPRGLIARKLVNKIDN
jgi:hypothetical protein